MRSAIVTPRSTISPSTWWNMNEWVGVDRVGPVDAADRDDPHRRRLRLHHADLHGAGLAAQEGAAGQVEVVERVARRVGGRDVQGLEVVASVLDLRPPGDGEPEPAEEVHQLVGRLGQGVPMAELRPRPARQGHVQPAGAGRGPLDPSLGRVPGRFQGPFDGVEPLPVGPLLGRVQGLEPLLRGLDAPLLLAEELDPRGLDGRRRVGGTERGEALGFQLIEVGQGRFGVAHGGAFTRGRSGGSRRKAPPPAIAIRARPLGAVPTASPWRARTHESRNDSPN